jgi:inorganic pyrophosphatase
MGVAREVSKRALGRASRISCVTETLVAVEELEVVIDVPRGGFIKRTDAGAIDYISPFPCPFNYGSVPDTLSGDGDRLDAIVLGPARARGSRVRCRVVAVVRFTDAGQDDPKYVCAEQAVSERQLAEVERFFARYSWLKGLLNLLRGKRGATRYAGLERRSAAHAMVEP